MVKATKVPYVLIIEDDFEIRDVLCDYLRIEGYEAAGVENGLAALDYLRSSETLPCLIILDVMMPVMDGYAFREEQIKDARFAEIPTAMISADNNIQQNAQRAGLKEYLRKPIELADFLGLVQKYCN